MEKSIFSPLYEPIRQKLVEMREAASLSQAQLARRLRRPPSFVAKIEQKERRVDLLEFILIARACGVAPERALLDVARKIKTVEKFRARRR